MIKIKHKKLKIPFITLFLFIFTSQVLSYQSDPNNAALLYYQAYISYEKADETIMNMVDDFSKGEIELNEKIKKYIKNCRVAIKLAADAGDIPNCDWGLKYSDGFNMRMEHLGQARYLSSLIVSDARIFADEGDYPKAIDRYLTARKLAQHISDENIISILVSVAVNKLADSCIRDVLGDMPDDLDTLKSLKTKLALIANKPLSVKRAFRTEEIMRLNHMEQPTEMLVGEPFENADESFVAKNRDYYKKYMDSVQEILSLPESYVNIYTKLKELNDKLQKDASDNPNATMAARLAPRLFNISWYEVRDKNNLNAIRAAIEIYIIKVRSGKFPDELPEGLPKDLFSDKDFIYAKTGDGFILRCQGKDLDKNKIHEYKFKINK